MTTECQSWAAELSAYADDETEEAVATALQEHLVECADCRGDLARTHKLKSLLKEAVPGSAADESVGKKLWARFSKAMPGKEPGPGSAMKSRPLARG